MRYSDVRDFCYEEVKKLYKENGWMSYVNKIDNTMLAIKNSFYVYSCFDNDKLVGLLRAVSDGFTILYIQDILVLPSYQSKGIGTKLLKDTLEKFNNIYQTVLITDDTEKTNNYYKKLGLKSGENYSIIPFIRMNN